jgi:methionine synthase II (cobalamin-independent)
MLKTLGIGSLPHTQREMAIQYAFRFDIPFLPELPNYNKSEFMLPLATSGVPGFEFDETGMPLIDEDDWNKYQLGFSNQTSNNLKERKFQRYYPDHTCLNPFLFDCEEKQVERAKMQLTGPCTIQWLTKHDDLFSFLLCRAASMIVEFQRTCPQTRLMFTLDEPGFYTFNPRDPNHIVDIQKLKTFILYLKKFNVDVGIHCCSNTSWEHILDLPIDYLSIDFTLSFKSLLQSSNFESFLGQNKKLALGIVPTNPDADVPTSGEIIETLGAYADKILPNAYLSPSCGLALADISFCEKVFRDLSRLKSELTS